MSTISAINPAEPLLGNPFTAFDGGFKRWDENNYDHLFPFLIDQLPSNPVGPDHDQDQILACLDKASPDSVLSQTEFNPNPNLNLLSGSGGSDEPNQNRTGLNSGSCSNDSNQGERKRKRMLSNRESARRSRMRRQKHVENLRNELNQLKLENQEHLNWLQLITDQVLLLRAENDRFRTESVFLHSRLTELTRILQLQQRAYSSSIPMHAHATIFNSHQP